MWLGCWWLIIDKAVRELIFKIQMNLRRIVLRADEISQEFRRVIHYDLTTQKGSKKLAILRDLLETDNLIREVIAKLRHTHSQIRINVDQPTFLLEKEFLESLSANLLEMFETFDRINRVMEIDEHMIDDLVLETIDSLDQLSNLQ